MRESERQDGKRKRRVRGQETRIACKEINTDRRK
jgi:hypothetical protein